MIYFDSKQRKFTSKAAETQLMRIITDQRFRLDKTVQVDKKTELLNRYLAGQKAAIEGVDQGGAFQGNCFPSYPLFGIHGLDYAYCEWVEMGYGIFDGYSDGERLLSWLGPQFLIENEKIIFRVTDWRARMAASRGSDNAWACAPIDASDVRLDGCVFDYCFDWDRYNYVSVPAGIKPSDSAIPCIPQLPLNVFGQTITDPDQLADWELSTKARLFMLQRIVDGDWADTTPTDALQEDGVNHFFDNWATRHADLGSYCLTEFAPVTIPITGNSVAEQMEMFLTSLSNEVLQIEWRVAHLDGGGQVDWANVAVLMNPWDAACINWYQACLTKCSTTVFNVNNPGDIDAFWNYFYNRFTQGTFGGGTIRLRDGRSLNIMQMEHLARGTVIMLNKGWGGSRPNQYGMRVAAMQYSNYYSRIIKRAPLNQFRYQVLMNGAWLKEIPLDQCGCMSVRWNMRLFSNAPWLQRRWTGFPACTDFTAPTNWPTLPDLPLYVHCSPDTIVLPT